MRKNNIQQKKDKNQYSNGTILNTYVYLRFKDDLNSPPKKIKYPNSVQSLLKLAQKLFSDVIDVKTLFTKNGKLIEYIDDVIPGDTIYVSSISENEEENNQIKIRKRVKVQNNDQNNDKNDIAKQESYNKIFGNQNAEDNVRVNVVSNTRIIGGHPQRSKERSQIPTLKKPNENSNNNKDENDNKSQTQSLSSNSVKKSNKNRKKKIGDHYEYDYDEYDKAQDSENDFSRTNSKKSNSESLNSEFSKRNSRNESFNNNNGYNKNSRVNKTKDAWSLASENEKQTFINSTADLAEIFKKVLHEDTLAKNVPKSLYLIYNNDSDIDDDNNESLIPIDFYTNLTNFSQCLDYYWIKKGFELFDKNMPNDPEIYGLNEMVSIVHDIISKHRVPHAQTAEVGNKKNKKNKDTTNFYAGVDYRFNTAIIGPRKSGKSTLLSIFAKELLFEFVATESTKKYFIVNLDLSKLQKHADNPQKLFHEIVDITMLCLQWNCPCYTPYIQSITAFFKSITDDLREIDPESQTRKPPMVPSNFRLNPDFQYVAHAFQSIANRLTLLWDSDDMYPQWVTSVLFFADSIARAVGIQKLLYIIDNIDLLDVEIHSTPNNHFKSFHECIFLGDILKYLLSTDEFIISCQDQANFYQFLTPISDDFISVDFKNKVELHSTINLIDIHQENENDDLYQNKIISVVVDFDGEDAPIYISINHTGGIPVFVFLWKEINYLFDEIEQYDENSIEYQEAYVQVVSQTSIIIFQMFLSQDGSEVPQSLNIVSVKRSDKSK